jgi:hypothetical protein
MPLDLHVTFVSMPPLEAVIEWIRPRMHACARVHPELHACRVEVRPPHANTRDRSRWRVRVTLTSRTLGRLVEEAESADLHDALVGATAAGAEALDAAGPARHPGLTAATAAGPRALSEALAASLARWSGVTHVPPPQGPPRPMFSTRRPPPGPMSEAAPPRGHARSPVPPAPRAPTAPMPPMVAPSSGTFHIGTPAAAS